MSNNTHDDHSFKDSFTPENPFVSNNLPNKFSAKHIKLLSFLKWFHDNNLNLHDFLHHDTHTSLYSLHRFLDFESQFSKRFKSFLKKLQNNNNNKQQHPLKNNPTLYQHTNDKTKNEFNEEDDNDIKSNEKTITFNEKKTIQKKHNNPVPENSSDFVKMIIESAIE